MVRPANFKSNPETKINNHYQVGLENVLPATLQQKALKEFDDYVDQLKAIGVNVIVVEDHKERNTPDAVFANNWISFHENGNVGLYPMFAKNRRLERREDVLDTLESKGFVINDVIDYTSAEDEGFYLEGTGSIVLDRQNRKAYCALSARTDEDLCIEFCEDFEFTPVIFKATQTVNHKRELIYHTNVMLSIGNTFAIVCLDCVEDKKERKNLLKHLKSDGKHVINLTEAQVASFAANAIQLTNNKQESFLIISTLAYNALTASQIKSIEAHTNIVSVNLETIETYGGGSARCMITEIFLPVI